MNINVLTTNPSVQNNQAVVKIAFLIISFVFEVPLS